MNIIAWSLHSPSASGGKEYRVILAGGWVAVGWGSVTRGSIQYKVRFLNSAASAQAWAVEQTATKEKGGYSLDGEPHVFISDQPEDGILAPFRIHTRGTSTSLDAYYRLIMTSGQAVGA